LLKDFFYFVFLFEEDFYLKFVPNLLFSKFVKKIYPRFVFVSFLFFLQNFVFQKIDM